MSQIIRAIINNTHPTYKALGEGPSGVPAGTAAAKSEWQRNEDRFRAGRHVRDELIRYGWESATGDSYLARRLVAVCPPLWQTTAERFVGLAWENVPMPDGGNLGGYRPPGERGDKPTPWELIYDAVDGTGYASKGWDAFFRHEWERATATGWRWRFLDMDPVAERDRRRGVRRRFRGSFLQDGGETRLEDLADGFRPYVVAYSPLAVPDWHYDNGTLQYARIVTADRRPRIKDGAFFADEEREHLLLVRPGYDGFGDEFAGGGWWRINAEAQVVASGEGQDRVGGWAKERGEIPMWRAIYDEEGGGLAELGNAQVALMNNLSDLWHDAHNGAGHGLTAIGVTPGSFNKWAEQWVEGSRLRALEAQEGVTPTIHDDGAATVSDAVLASIREHLALAKDVMMRELETAPDASGTSRAVEFVQGNSPRLVSMAMGIEEDMNMAGHFFHRRLGLEPAGGVTVNKRYDLRSAQAKLGAFFDLLDKRGARVPTLETEALLEQAERDGLLTGEATRDVVRGELGRSLGAALTSAEANAERTRAAADVDTRMAAFRAEIAAGGAPAGAGGDGAATPAPEVQ